MVFCFYKGLRNVCPAQPSSSLCSPVYVAVFAIATQANPDLLKCPPYHNPPAHLFS